MKAKLIKTENGYGLEDVGIIAFYSSKRPVHKHYKLSKQNCDEIFGVVDVESLALSKASFFGGTYRNPEGFSDEQVGYLHGFIEAMELNKDKQFTENDVIRAIVHYTYLLYNDGKGFEEGDNNDDRIECVIASLKQKPIEIEVEVEMEPCFYDDSLGGFSTSYTEDKPKEQPKLDSDGCLILKKV